MRNTDHPTIKQKYLDLIAFAYALWLAGMMLVQFLAHGDHASIIIGFSAGSIPVALHVWMLGVRRGNDQLGTILFSLFALIVLTSLMLNLQRLEVQVALQTFGFFAVVGIGYLLAQQSESKLLERIFVWNALLLSAVVLIVLLDGDRLWGRLMGRLHSNLWAGVALAAVPGALALRNKFTATLVTAFLLYMIGMEFNARGPLLYSIAIAFAYIAFWALETPHQALSARILFLGTLLCGATAIALVSNWSYLSNEVLMLDSATRGIASGLTGRTELWAYMVDIASDHPFTGVGFRMHDTFITAPGVYSAHNAYIAMLVDLGATGFVTYITILLASTWRSITRAKSLVISSYLIGYALLGMTEARALNVGNPASLLFIMSLSAMLSTPRTKPTKTHPIDGYRRSSWQVDALANR